MIEALGYSASVAVLATFLMRTMLPLRLIAIANNLLFICYAYFAHIPPVLILHIALLPINLLRLLTLRANGRGQAAPFTGLQTSGAAPPRPYTRWFVAGLVGGVICGVGLISVASHAGFAPSLGNGTSLGDNVAPRRVPKGIGNNPPATPALRDPPIRI
jgi:hypothetical protein